MDNLTFDDLVPDFYLVTIKRTFDEPKQYRAEFLKASGKDHFGLTDNEMSDALCGKTVETDTVVIRPGRIGVTFESVDI